MKAGTNNLIFNLKDSSYCGDSKIEMPKNRSIEKNDSKIVILLILSFIIATISAIASILSVFGILKF